MPHDVTNQSQPLAGGNAWRNDPLLVQLSESFAAPVRKELETLGRYVLNQDALELARLANTETPKLKTHDRQGHRLDLVEFHPAYHALMRRSASAGLHCSIWENGADEAGMRHQSRAARFFLMSQLECGHLCPMTMTNASLAALMANAKLFREWAPRVTSRAYDSSHKPPVEKSGLTLGMGMTEKQGGTDVRANTSRGERLSDGSYVLSGHKWFMSAPMSDAFLMLAQTHGGLSCFLVPRVLSDGRANGLHFQRLKDKLGNRSNASSEVEFDGVLAEMVGEPGAGVRTIMDMVTLTRLDCALASAGMMRAGLAEAVNHTRQRAVFGAKLIDQPLMMRVLADMALDVAAATALTFRLARSFDSAAQDRAEASYARIMTPVVKYWACKLAPPLLYEAMECLGGNGYVEESTLARLYREAPVNAIWEGSGNVMALDLARVMSRAPEALDQVISTIEQELGVDQNGQMSVLRTARDMAASDEGSARLFAEQLAYSAAAVELKNLGAGRIAYAFISSRLGGQWRTTYGMLTKRHDPALIVESLYPASS